MNWTRSASVTVRLAVAKTEPSVISSQVRPVISGSTSEDGTNGCVVVMRLPFAADGDGGGSWSAPKLPGSPRDRLGEDVALGLAPHSSGHLLPRSRWRGGTSRRPGSTVADPGQILDGRLPQLQVVLVGGVAGEPVDDVAEALPDRGSQPVGLGDDREGVEDFVV